MFSSWFLACGSCLVPSPAGCASSLPRLPPSSPHTVAPSHLPCPPLAAPFSLPLCSSAAPCTSPVLGNPSQSLCPALAGEQCDPWGCWRPAKQLLWPGSQHGKIQLQTFLSPVSPSCLPSHDCSHKSCLLLTEPLPTQKRESISRERRQKRPQQRCWVLLWAGSGRAEML